jgi:hypothetical protein
MPSATVLTASASGQTGIVSGSNLVTQVARMVGGESEGAIRAQALDCINRVRIELNQHDLGFMKTTDGAITLVDGTATYALESTFRKPVYASLVDASGTRTFDLDYYNDAIALHDQPDMSATGRPQFYMLRNDFQDGLITLYPTPDATAASDDRLVVEYYARIEGIADSTDPVNLPEEVTNCLVVGGQAYMLRERDKVSPALGMAFADYQRIKALLMVDDRRIADERVRFRLGVSRTIPFGTMLIRI